MWIKPAIKELIRVSDIPEQRTGMCRMDRNECTWPIDEMILEEIKGRVTSELITNYPENEQLYDKMAEHIGVTASKLIFHSGSDLVIKSIYETYIQKGDKILLHAPSYAMYDVYAMMFQANVIKQYYNKNLELELDEYKDKIHREKPKMVVLENPNGFIGNSYSMQDVEQVIIEAYKQNSLIVIDEAYIDFTNESVINLVDKYENLIVVRTLSKAWGMAGMRVGYAVSNEQIISELLKVKPMHQLTAFSIMVAEVLLEHPKCIEKYIKEVTEVREYFIKELNALKIATASSKANFVAVKLGTRININDFKEYVREQGFLIRRPFREEELKDWVRIGILPMEQMKKFMCLLEEYMEIE